MPMSTRTDSPFGSLGDRVRSGGRPSAPRTPIRHVVVDGRFPGVLISWRREASGWFAMVGFVVDERLLVEQVPAARLRPASGVER